MGCLRGLGLSCRGCFTMSWVRAFSSESQLTRILSDPNRERCAGRPGWRHYYRGSCQSCVRVLLAELNLHPWRKSEIGLQLLNVGIEEVSRFLIACSRSGATCPVSRLFEESNEWVACYLHGAVKFARCRWFCINRPPERFLATAAFTR